MDDSGFFSIQASLWTLIRARLQLFFNNRDSSLVMWIITVFLFVADFQVICNALKVWEIELIPFLSPESKEARENPQ